MHCTQLNMSIYLGLFMPKLFQLSHHLKELLCSTPLLDQLNFILLSSSAIKAKKKPHGGHAIYLMHFTLFLQMHDLALKYITLH